MQDDPRYVKMMEKSFIMSKYRQRHPQQRIPQIKKEPEITHRVAVTGVLSTLIHCIAYPLDTIKIRKMAKHKTADIARFEANRVITLTPYLGFFKGYLAVLVGNLCFLTLGQVNFFLGVASEGLLKTWIDMSKISSQMGNGEMNMTISRKVFLPAACFSIVRDTLSRGSYILIVDRLIQAYKDQLTKDTNLKYHIYFGSAILATLISHPFDLAFTKLASQRQYKYKGIFSCLKTVFKEEGFGKFYSGIDFRIFYSLVSIIIMGNSYDSLMKMALDAF